MYRGRKGKLYVGDGGNFGGRLKCKEKGKEEEEWKYHVKSRKIVN